MIAALSGCRKVALEPAEIEKFCQLMMAFSVDWVMTVLVALGEAIVACPATTLPPVGPAAVAGA